jgi:hypothetical protein
MNHLSAAEFVDFAEGALDPSRASHVNRCEACAAQTRDLLAMIERSAASADVPEPSPLFWDHLSARVRDAVLVEPATGTVAVGWGWRARGFLPLAATLTVAVALLSVTLVPRREAVSRSADGTVAAATVAALDGLAEPTVDANSAEAWDVLTAAAADLEWEAAHEAGMSVQPGAVERAVQQLNADEMNEPGRLLQSELKRSGD